MTITECQRRCLKYVDWNGSINKWPPGLGMSKRTRDAVIKMGLLEIHTYAIGTFGKASVWRLTDAGRVALKEASKKK